MIVGLYSCSKLNLPPIAKLTAFPRSGDTSILFEFKAGESIDDRTYPIGLKYRWDLGGDGIWETTFDQFNIFTHSYLHPGVYKVVVEVMDLDGLSALAKDSIMVFGENLDIDTLVDSRDGNKYRIVKIQGKWWMAENMRYGSLIPTSMEQDNNNKVERYRLIQWLSQDTIGGVYRWLEAMNYDVNNSKGICPEGWHVATKMDWEELSLNYPINYSCKYFGKGGLSNLNLDNGNRGIRWADGFFQEFQQASFWSSSFNKEGPGYGPYLANFNSRDHYFAFEFSFETGPENATEEISYYSVRCVKDK